MSQDEKTEAIPVDKIPILVAEDNPVARRLLEKNLIKAGHPVICAENGQQALERFQESFCPIILTDWMMPELDGIELCRAIRNQASPGYVFIVFLTSKDTKEDIISALEAGADDYLTKPFHQAELIARIKTGKRILDLERSLKAANEDIKTLSITDPLTGSFNRGYLMARLPEEVSRAKRYKHPLSVIMCDLDHFKGVNDSHGHLAGDAVLKEFVNCIHEAIRRDIDWVARYGGEEFLIVLSETEFEGAMAVSERLRQSVGSRTIQVEKQPVRVTASFGVAALDPSRGNGYSSESLIKEADRCLYLAKEQGRNRVRGRC